MASPCFQLHRIDAPDPLGTIFIVIRERALVALDFADVEGRLMRLLRGRFDTDIHLQESDGSSAVVESVRAYLAGDFRALDDIAIDSGGTEFQQRAWSALREIPPGETRSYGQMAAMLGKPNAARAVGHANALNPFNLVVPCHRLVGGNGALTGYGGGLARKRWLLEHESRAVSAGGAERSVRFSG